MLALCVVELNNAFASVWFFKQRASNCQHISIWVPLNSFNKHTCIYQSGWVVCWRLHQLYPSALVGDAKRSWIFFLVLVREALSVLIIPLDCRQRNFLVCNFLKTHNLNWVLKVAHIVINVYCAFWCAKQYGAAVRWPLNDLKLNLQLFTPKARSFDWTDNNRAIFVNNSNLFTIWSPAHVSNDTFVSIVDHLFIPVLLMEHPDNDQTLLVRGSKLLVLVIPLNYNNIALMALQILIHGKIAAALTFSGL